MKWGAQPRLLDNVASNMKGWRIEKEAVVVYFKVLFRYYLKRARKRKLLENLCSVDDSKQLPPGYKSDVL